MAEMGFDVITFTSKTRQSIYFSITKDLFIARVRLSTHPPGKNWDRFQTGQGSANLYCLVYPGSKYNVKDICKQITDKYENIINPEVLEEPKLVIHYKKVKDVPLNWWFCIDTDGTVLTSPDEPYVTTLAGVDRWVGNWVGGHISSTIGHQNMHKPVSDEYKWKRTSDTTKTFEGDFTSAKLLRENCLDELTLVKQA